MGWGTMGGGGQWGGGGASCGVRAVVAIIVGLFGGLGFIRMQQVGGKLWSGVYWGGAGGRHEICWGAHGGLWGGARGAEGVTGVVVELVWGEAQRLWGPCGIGGGGLGGC